MSKQTNTAGAGRPNSLGLRENQLNKLRNTLDQGKKSGKADRLFSRWHYSEGSVPVKIIHPAGNEMDVRMACRNLSKGGIGLLHRSYLHLGTQCNVTLQHPSQGEITLTGKVVRCIHLTGMVHEIGISFEEEIDIRDIMRPDPMQEMLAVETIDPSTLVGTILLVEDSEMDTRLVRHFLRDTQLRIKHVETIGEAEKMAKSGVGLILCDIHLGPENGGDLAKKLHESSATTPPVVMTSADTGEATHDLVSHPGVEGFLAKPFSQESLDRTIAEFFTEPVEDEGDGETGATAIDRQVYDALLPELGKAVEKLGKSAEAGDTTGVLAILMQLKGVAPVLGLSDLSMLLETMTFQLSSSFELDTIRGQIADVVNMCDEIVKSG